MNVKPVDFRNSPPEPLRESIRRQLGLAAEIENGEWVDLADLLAEPTKPLPLYTRAWHWFCRLDPVWWLRYRTTHRYHVVQTGLAPDYHDSVERMLYACFRLLVDFVEKECGGVRGLERQAKWGGRHGEMATECLALYWWWTEIRPRRGEEDFDMEDVYDARDDEMLVRLVKVRRWLWT